MIPVTAPFGIALGTAMSIASLNNAVTGKDWLTGRELGTTERVIDGVFGAVGTLTGAHTIAKQAVNTGLVDDALKLLTSGSSTATNTAKTATNTVPTAQGNSGSLKMDLQFFAGKGDDVAGIGDETTKTIYRGVGADEFYEVMETGNFRPNPSGRSLEAKQFGNNVDEVLNFSDKSFNKDISAIVEVKIPESTYNNLNHLQLDPGIFKSGTVTVEADMLKKFNESIVEISHKY